VQSKPVAITLSGSACAIAFITALKTR